jgi:hypothetical protein
MATPTIRKTTLTTRVPIGPKHGNLPPISSPPTNVTGTR